MADMMRSMSERKVIEINPSHPIINKLAKMTEENAEDEKAHSLIATLFQTALIESGFSLADPFAFVGEIQNVIAEAMQIEDVNELIEIEIPEEEEEETAEKSEDDDAEEVDIDSMKFDEDDAEEIIADEEAETEENVEEDKADDTEEEAATEEGEASEEDKEEL